MLLHQFRWIGLIGFLATLVACGPAPSSELTVFAASSLTDAFDEIAAAFETEHPGVNVLASYASSSELAIQLSEGARADVFAPANRIQMEVAIDAGRIVGDPVDFLTNRLTIIVPYDNPADIQSPADLARVGVALILAAPGVPARGYSDQAIALAGDSTFQAAVYANMVSEEPNVRQVASKVALGEADAGIVYVSDVTPDIDDRVIKIPIPDEQNVIATYPIAVVQGAPSGALASDFVAFVLGDAGQAILAKWGFGPKP